MASAITGWRTVKFLFYINSVRSSTAIRPRLKLRRYLEKIEIGHTSRVGLVRARRDRLKAFKIKGLSLPTCEK
jgi:hypothetical protein